MMKNKYVIDGDTLIIYNRKDNRKMFFDADDFDFVNRHTWVISIDKNKKYEWVGSNIKQVSGKFKTKTAHRLLMNEPADMLVDHQNGNTLDNRKANLRKTTAKVNAHNRTKARGYYWNKKSKKWNASINANHKTMYLGLYNTEDEARAAYLEGKKKYHPSAPIHLYT
jgi:hypothetical protein